MRGVSASTCERSTLFLREIFWAGFSARALLKMPASRARRKSLRNRDGRGLRRTEAEAGSERRGARARAGLPVEATSVGGILLAVVPLQGILKIAASSSPSLLDIARNIYSHALHHTRPGPGYFDLDSEAPTMVIRLLTVGRCS